MSDAHGDPTAEVMAWTMKIMSRSDLTPYQLLGLLSSATPDKIRDAFHRIARTNHPDLHRATLGTAELELVTRAYSRVAAAYQELRSGRAQAAKPASGAPVPTGISRLRPPTKPPAGTTSATPTPGSPQGTQMNAKAQLYYRKVELALRKGEIAGAILQLKMACTADPQSTFLRSALAELQAELAKGR